MAFFPMVAVAWFVRAGRVGPTGRQPSRLRFFRRRSRQNRRSATGLGKFNWETVYLGDFQEKAMLTPKPANGLGKIEAEPVYHGDPAFFRWRLCQTRRPGLGKFLLEPVYHGDSAEKSGVHAKMGDSPAIWENIWKPVYHGDFLMKKRRSRQNRRPTTGLGKFPAEPVYLGDSPRKARWDRRNHPDWRNHSDRRNKKG